MQQAYEDRNKLLIYCSYSFHINSLSVTSRASEITCWASVVQSALGTKQGARAHKMMRHLDAILRLWSPESQESDWDKMTASAEMRKCIWHYMLERES